MIVKKMEEKSIKIRSGIKTAIIVLSVLLAASIAMLAGSLIYRSVVSGKPAAVTVPDNIITTDAEDSPSEAAATDSKKGFVPKDSADPSSIDASEAPAYRGNSSVGGDVQPSSADVKKQAAVISLYQKHAEDNQAFQTSNMFPGDAETKYYCVKISHSGDVDVHYRANIRPGYEKLAEALRCRVVLLTNGVTLYDGLMRDMPESLVCSVKTDEATESELYYGITAYLDTGVCNEYQNRDLIADFRWWVQDTGSLEPPYTGDNSNIYLGLGLAFASLLIILFLIRKRRREDCENG